jgi:hypothetical protein
MGDDGFVFTMLAGYALCRACIARRTGLSPPAIDTIVARIAHALVVVTAPAPCDGCAATTTVFRVA